jgi:hypothetical protein
MMPTLDDAPSKDLEHFQTSKAPHVLLFTFIYISSYLSSQILSEQVSLFVKDSGILSLFHPKIFWKFFICIVFHPKAKFIIFTKTDFA